MLFAGKVGGKQNLLIKQTDYYPTNKDGQLAAAVDGTHEWTTFSIC